VLILATTAPWPQPLEGAALLVVVFAQASVLWWQDHDPENTLKDLIEKIPDVAAVVVGAYALGDARNKYIDKTIPRKEFSTFHDPNSQMFVAYALTGVGFVIGVYQEFSVWLEPIAAQKNGKCTFAVIVKVTDR
jgi:hypothetical protein